MFGAFFCMAMLMFPIVPVLRGSFSDSTLGKVLTELMDPIISIKLVSMTLMTKMVARNYLRMDVARWSYKRIERDNENLRCASYTNTNTTKGVSVT